MSRVPKAEWAVEKCRLFVPAIKEKPVLLAIAGHCKPDGSGAYCGRASIAHEVGQTIRTVIRHIKALEALGLLVVKRGGAGGRDRSRYYIPCCSFSVEDLEVLTGVSGRQLVLPMATDQERSEVMISELWTTVGLGKTGALLSTSLENNGCQFVTPGVTNSTNGGDKLSPQHGKNMLVKQEEKGILLEKRKLRDFELQQLENDAKLKAIVPLTQDPMQILLEVDPDFHNALVNRVDESCVTSVGAIAMLDDLADEAEALRSEAEA
jgi:hypothetical protein